VGEARASGCELIDTNRLIGWASAARRRPGTTAATTKRIFFLTTNRSRANEFASSLIEGRLRRHPEGGARRGVLRRRLVTACPGRPGTPPARHYDLAARSSLHGSGRQLPAVVGRRAPKETEARPRGPKPPRWSAERRASRVMGRKAPRKRLTCRVMACPTGVLSAAPERLSALRPPSFGVSEAKLQTPDAKNAPRERVGVRCLTS